MTRDADAAIARAILELCAARGPEKSICPSEAARRLWPEGWRARLDEVRRVGAALAADGRIDITQKGVRAPPDAPLRGPIRYRARA